MNRYGNDQGCQWGKENYDGEFKLLAEKQCESSMILCEGENIDNMRHLEEYMKNESQEKRELANV